MQSESQALHALLSHLPPGPWHARGNKVLAGDSVVAIVMCKNAAFVANQMAHLPDLLVSKTVRVEELEHRITELETKLEEYTDGDESDDNVEF